MSNAERRTDPVDVWIGAARLKVQVSFLDLDLKEVPGCGMS